MQFTTALLSTVLAATSLAAPLSMSAATEWTIEGLARTCAEDYSSCEWTFGIATGEGEPTACTFTVEASGETPATEAPGGPSECGVYTVTSGYDAAGFTVLSVTDYEAGLIAWPGYTDAQLQNGTTVDPDLSFPVSNLPA